MFFNIKKLKIIKKIKIVTSSFWSLASGCWQLSKRSCFK